MSRLSDLMKSSWHFAWLIVALALGSVAPASNAQRAPVDPWEADIARFEAADHVDPPAPGALLFIGSSSIRLWDSLAADFPNERIIKRGFGGSEIRDATRVAARIVVPYRPRLVLLYAGDNDLASGRTAAEVVADFRTFVARVHADLPDTGIAFIAIKPSPARAHLLEDSRAANAAIADWARTRPDIHFIDVFTPTLDAQGQPRETLFGPDRLHLNRAGYAIWIERIAALLKQAPRKPE